MIPPRMLARAIMGRDLKLLKSSDNHSLTTVIDGSPLRKFAFVYIGPRDLAANQGCHFYTQLIVLDCNDIDINVSYY